MATVHDSLEGKLLAFVTAQPMFFVATAPLSDAGRINVSPKGMRGTFLVHGPNRVSYLDYHGSGAETIAHLRENGRITLMFCAFDGPPNIVRLYGNGTWISIDDPGCAALIAEFPDPPDLHGVRAVITVDVDRVSSSCGYSVPFLAYVDDRDLLIRNHQRKDDDALANYRHTRNAASIDGLPALDGTVSSR